MNRKSVSRDLHSWVRQASKGSFLYTCNDAEFREFVKMGMYIVEKSNDIGFDGEFILCDLLADEIDIERISEKRLATLMAHFPATSKSIDFIGVDITKRLILLEARFVSANGNGYKEAAVLQCYRIAAKTGSLNGYLKAVDLTSRYFAVNDLYNEDTFAVLSAMLEGLTKIKDMQSCNFNEIVEGCVNTFNLIAKDEPEVQTKTLAQLLSSKFANIAISIYPHCNFVINDALFFENSYKSHGCNLSEDKITTLVNEHVGDETAYEYLAELTRLKFARGDTDGYDKFFQANWATALDISCYLRVCLTDSLEYKNPLKAFSAALFRNADVIDDIKSGALGKIINILEETEEGKLMLRHARKNRASAKHVISSDFEL